MLVCPDKASDLYGKSRFISFYSKSSVTSRTACATLMIVSFRDWLVRASRIGWLVSSSWLEEAQIFEKVHKVRDIGPSHRFGTPNLAKIPHSPDLNPRDFLVDDPRSLVMRFQESVHYVVMQRTLPEASRANLTFIFLYSDRLIPGEWLTRSKRIVRIFMARQYLYFYDVAPKRTERQADPMLKRNNKSRPNTRF